MITSIYINNTLNKYVCWFSGLYPRHFPALEEQKISTLWPSRVTSQVAATTLSVSGLKPSNERLRTLQGWRNGPCYGLSSWKTWLLQAIQFLLKDIFFEVGANPMDITDQENIVYHHSDNNLSKTENRSQELGSYGFRGFVQVYDACQRVHPHSDPTNMQFPSQWVRVQIWFVHFCESLASLRAIRL